MRYHIQTTPIWDAFNSECGCPMCVIYEKYSDRIVNQYLNEAVMEPQYRIKVNELGFCGKHFHDLYEGENKLGLSLQLSTRTINLINHLKQNSTFKDAKKQAELLRKMNSSCVICETVDEMMVRFAYTIAQMFHNESEFEQAFLKSDGFCFPHYVLLLEQSDKSTKSITKYLDTLYNVQIKGLERVNNDTKRFSNMFDHASSGSFKNADAAVMSAINKLKGNIISK